MKHDQSGMVQLDGSAIRHIREEQKLTQFYIAKVVGVTTDTVSRWENNRYPSVRRENALLLSEALEVPIEDILLETEVDAGGAGRSFPKLAIVVIGLVLFFSLVLFLFLMNSPAVVQYQVAVQRNIPPHAAVAVKFPVNITITATGEIDAMVLRENFPRGFKLVEASPAPSSLDNESGSVRWILQAGAEKLMVSYLLQPDSSIQVGGKYFFKGELIVNAKGENKSSPVLGETVVPVDVYHWADANRDFVIDDGEALDASVLSVAMKKVHIDWDLVEDIWDAGSYRLNPDTNMFVAVRKGSPK
jgi:transcriptional regulator with XRE-family HTH domain